MWVVILLMWQLNILLLEFMQIILNLINFNYR